MEVSSLRCYTLLAFATLALAADLPKSVGYVNDFAGQLSLSERQALENRLREYERATTNEVAVAIVESLDGESVDAYANRLFTSWGIGKKERNNGVLLLWAPVERKVRIEVGMGLGGAIPNTAAAEIVGTVTTLFRHEEYVRGLNAGVDAILARLDTDGPRYGSSSVPATEIPLESPRDRSWPLTLTAAVAGLAGLLVLMWRRGKRIRLAASVPRDLESLALILDDGEARRTAAVAALDKLRREAPQAVWEELAATVAGAGGELAGLRDELASIGAMPRQEYGELTRADLALKRWQGRFAQLREKLSAASGRLDSFHYCREHSALLLNELRESLDRRGPQSDSGAAAKLVQAANDTYARAVTAAAANPANWLLVYDLLMDAQECLECADNPGGFRRMNRTRNWMADDLDSPALALMMMMPSDWGGGSDVDTSSSMDSGGLSGGDSGGGGDFGGGDSAGGGASSDY
jgi:uncharacterized protein